MKWLAVMVLLTVTLLVLLYFAGRDGSEPEPVVPGAAPPAAPAASTPARRTPRALRRAAPPTPGAAAAPRQAPAQVQSRPSARMEELAREAGVTIAGYERTGGEAVIVVQWSSDNLTQGVDLIELMLRERIIRDFDPVGRNPREGLTADGRRLLSATYRLKFR